jgi:hypothetical protein
LALAFSKDDLHDFVKHLFAGVKELNIDQSKIGHTASRDLELTLESCHVVGVEVYNSNVYRYIT